MIKRLAGCIRQYKRDTILTPLFMVGEVSCECIIPLLTADLINNIQAGCSMDVILGYGLKLFLVAMLSLACGAASGWFCASSSAGFAKTSIIRCRTSRSRTLTGSLRPLSSRV